MTVSNMFSAVTNRPMVPDAMPRLRSAVSSTARSVILADIVLKIRAKAITPPSTSMTPTNA
jgi:hypothetical protein